MSLRKLVRWIPLGLIMLLWAVFFGLALYATAHPEFRPDLVILSMIRGETQSHSEQMSVPSSTSTPKSPMGIELGSGVVTINERYYPDKDGVLISDEKYINEVVYLEEYYVMPLIGNVPEQVYGTATHMYVSVKDIERTGANPALGSDVELVLEVVGGKFVRLLPKNPYRTCSILGAVINDHEVLVAVEQPGKIQLFKYPYTLTEDDKGNKSATVGIPTVSNFNKGLPKYFVDVSGITVVSDSGQSAVFSDIDTRLATLRPCETETQTSPANSVQTQQLFEAQIMLDWGWLEAQLSTVKKFLWFMAGGSTPQLVPQS